MALGPQPRVFSASDGSGLLIAGASSDQRGSQPYPIHFLRRAEVEVPSNYHGRRCGGDGNFGVQCCPVTVGNVCKCQYCGVDLLAFDQRIGGWRVLPFIVYAHPHAQQHGQAVLPG